MNTGWLGLFADIHTELRTRPGRAGITLLAVGLGIAALTGLLAVLGGLEERAEAAVRSLGTDVIGIFALETDSAAGMEHLDRRHAGLLAAGLDRARIATLKRYTAPTLASAQPLTVLETGPELLEVRQWRLADGRFIDAFDIEHRQRNAVISRSLAQRWGWQTGHVILLGNLAFTVVGIVDGGGAGLSTATSDPGLSLGEFAVLVPETTAPRWHFGGAIPDERVDALFIQSTVPGTLPATHAAARRILAQPDARAGELAWITADTLTREIRRLQLVLALTIGGTSLLVLALGGATLMSLMAANVRERTVEIGLRRALGAGPADIAALFVVEATLLTAVAGGIAVLAVAMLVPLVGALTPVPLRFGPLAVLVPLGTAVVLGASFAYWPARNAARIAPASALRA